MLRAWLQSLLSITLRPISEQIFFIITGRYRHKITGTSSFRLKQRKSSVEQNFLFFISWFHQALIIAIKRWHTLPESNMKTWVSSVNWINKRCKALRYSFILTKENLKKMESSNLGINKHATIQTKFNIKLIAFLKACLIMRDAN